MMKPSCSHVKSIPVSFYIVFTGDRVHCLILLEEEPEPVVMRKPLGKKIPIAWDDRPNVARNTTMSKFAVTTDHLQHPLHTLLRGVPYLKHNLLSWPM